MMTMDRIRNECFWAIAASAIALVFPAVIYWTLYGLYRLYQVLGVME